MTGFKVGDRVYVYPSGGHSGFGTITRFSGRGNKARVKPDEGDDGGNLNDVVYYAVERFSRAPRDGAFVHVVQNPSIWVTLPGDNAGHKLTQAEARQLLRELEEVV